MLLMPGARKSNGIFRRKRNIVETSVTKRPQDGLNSDIKRYTLYGEQHWDLVFQLANGQRFR